MMTTMREWPSVVREQTLTKERDEARDKLRQIRGIFGVLAEERRPDPNAIPITLGNFAGGICWVIDEFLSTGEQA